MKALDVFARRYSLPKYARGPQPPDWLLSIIVVIELRYESFTPNRIRSSKFVDAFSEPTELCIHIIMFLVLQILPQNLPMVLALEVLLAIYIIWTAIQLVVRYKTSPPLFGPIYRANSLAGFWSETWHNVFASPCESLAYMPLRRNLPRYGVPVSVARGLGILGAFGLMAVFHIYALAPILPQESLFRIGIFFVINGVATVAETAVWGKRHHWLKTVLAWTFEIVIATWTAQVSMTWPTSWSVRFSLTITRLVAFQMV
jgi:hypothetical protein